MSGNAQRSAARPASKGCSLAAAALLLTICCSPASAQVLNSGDAVITRFSGTMAMPGGGLAIDTSGASAIGLSIANPGSAPAGQAVEFPETFRVTAADVGQVFGVAIRPGVPATIYFTATSAFGLHLAAGGAGWMPGQWGAAGGPGTVYRLAAAPGARPEVFATISLDGRANTGAALGNIAYDAQHDQLFVSDLETGIIHRLDAEDGRELGRYDHGVEGRPSFTDLARLAPGSRPAVAFDPASAARIADCPDGAFGETPACWNIADFRRRVWGLGVFHDESLGETRLYYAVWSSQAFGNPDWNLDAQEQINTLWSVAIDSTGAFDTSDVRLEFDLPGFFVTEEDYARAGGSHPVSDIAFSFVGEMLLAERGGLQNLGLGAGSAFAASHEARVLKYQRDENRIWTPLGRYDVGFSDREGRGQPFLRANGGGGVALGFGHNSTGAIDLNQPDGFVWFTGDGLCADDGPCRAADGTLTDAGPLNGVQGQAAGVLGEINPGAAFLAYPVPGPATPPAGPEQAYMADAVDSDADDPSVPDARTSWVGDVEIAPAGPPAPAPAQGEPDLAVTKAMPTYCIAGSACTTQITVTNVGDAFWSGPIFLSDIVSPAGPGFAGASSPWSCATIGGSFACYHPHVALAPGEARLLVLDLAIPVSFTTGTLENCAAVVWPLATPNNAASVISAVQTALFIIGYDPGPIDGSFGALTRAAISALQADLGIPQTQAIDADLLDILFAGDAARPSDRNPANDRGCATTTLIPGDLPPIGPHLPVGSYGGHAFPASIHFPIGSSPTHVFPWSIHLPIGSVPAHVFPWSIHLPLGSGPAHLFPASIHLPLGSGPAHLFPASIHLPLGSGPAHLFPASIHLPLGSAPAHVFPWSIHFPIGSAPAHIFPASIHLPLGSAPAHVFPWSIHFPIGSAPAHVFPASIHLPLGSAPAHLFPFSIHLPLGSAPAHFFPDSIHLPLGSAPAHLFPASIHLPIGSGPIHVPLGSIHLPLGSGGGIHLPIISGGGIHLPVGSAVHVPLGSAGGIHLPIGSGGGVHIPIISGGGIHIPAGSGAPIHLPIGSGGGPHLPVGSAGGIHLPVGSGLTSPEEEVEDPIIHLPVGSAPAHQPVGSQPEIHLPIGSQPEIHLPIGSQPEVHQPAGSEPEVHLPIGSEPQIHLPLGSEPEVHQPRGSEPQIHLPLGSEPQVHQPRGSEPQIHLPLGSEPEVQPEEPVHQPRGSLQLHLPLGSEPAVQEPEVPQHRPRGSQPEVIQPDLPILEIPLQLQEQPVIQ